MSTVELRDLSVRLGETAVISGVDLEAHPGEWLGIIGPNGAGKSTILNTIVGTVEATSGSVLLSGRPVSAFSRQERARTVALVPQRAVVPAAMPVIDYVLLGRSPHIAYLASESLEDVAAAKQALGALDLLALSHRALAELSGGELQRVVLARALAQGAPIMLLDEPTSALDVGHQQQVLSLVDTMRRTAGLTIISALHDLTLAAQFCDRLLMLSGGRVVSEGRARSVLTEAVIREHYGATVRVLDDGDGGVVVIPVRDSRPDPVRATMGPQP